MAVCDYCKQEMMDSATTTCTFEAYEDFWDGIKRKRLPYAPEDKDPDHRCHDCGVKAGGLHHPGCDMERCPKCKGQAISCGCHDGFDDEEE